MLLFYLLNLNEAQGESEIQVKGEVEKEDQDDEENMNVSTRKEASCHFLFFSFTPIALLDSCGAMDMRCTRFFFFFFPSSVFVCAAVYQISVADRRKNVSFCRRCRAFHSHLSCCCNPCFLARTCCSGPAIPRVIFLFFFFTLFLALLVSSLLLFYLHTSRAVNQSPAAIHKSTNKKNKSFF